MIHPVSYLSIAILKYFNPLFFIVGTKMFINRGVFKAPNCLNSELIKLLYQPFFLSEGFIFRSLILFTVMNGDKASLIRQLNRLHFTLPLKPVSEFIVFSLYFEKTCPGCECLLRFYLCFCNSWALSASSLFSRDHFGEVPRTGLKTVHIKLLGN